MRDRLLLAVAQGLGAGRLTWAPGTWGSVVGLVWFAALLATGSMLVFFLAAGLAALGSVWICGAAEKILHQHDPSSVVLDEIIAVPFCFAAFLIIESRHGSWPTVESFFSGTGAVRMAIVFALFRVFDILKPWPVRQLQRLPGGWGVTVDDVAAAAYVNVVQLPFLLSAETSPTTP